MEDQRNQLERLSTLLNEDRISHNEFEVLKAWIDETNAPPEHLRSVDDETAAFSTRRGDTGRTRLLNEPASPTLRALIGIDRPQRSDAGTPPIYKASLGMGIASFFLGGTFGHLAWATIAVSGYAVYSVRYERRRWMAWTGLALGVIFTLMNLYTNGHLDELMADDGTPNLAQQSSQSGSTRFSDLPPPPTIAHPATSAGLSWAVGACARQGSNRLLWSLTPCSSSWVDALVIDTPFLSSDCPAQTDFYLEPTGARIACMIEHVVRP